MRGNSLEFQVAPLRILGGEFLRGQEQHRGAVGHLRAVAHLDPARDRLVELFRLLRIALAAGPRARLRERVAPGVGEIDRRDVRQVFVLEPVALVVFVAQAPEQRRERISNSLAFALVPSRGAEEVAAGRGIDGFHLLQANHRGKVVVAGFDIGRGGEDGDRTRGAGGLMARGRDAEEFRVDLEEEGVDLALLAVEFGGKVADMSGLDFARLDSRLFHRGVHRLAHHGGKVLALLVPVAGEVALPTAENIDAL